ncbi:hypothetical protein [Streptomyces pactum]|nr:hypothetical protein [Streptomyces pactum]
MPRTVTVGTPLPRFCARVPEERREPQGLERKITGGHWAQEPGHDLAFSAGHGCMTTDVYTHVVGDSEREAVGMLAELLEDPLIG